MANGKNGKAPAKPQVVELAETWLERRARDLALGVGRPAAFLIALGLILAWVIVGLVRGFDAWWHMEIGTATAVVTFLMVFLLQRAQNRDTLALQIKLAELIIAMEGAQNKVAVAETLPDQELEAIQQEHTEKAEEELDRLEHVVADGHKPRSRARRRRR